MSVKVITLADRKKAEKIAEIFEENFFPDGAVWLAEDGASDTWRVELYLDETNEKQAISLVQQALGDDASALTIKAEKIEELDWVSEGLKALPEVQAGRFLVRGRHLSEAPSAGHTLIEIDAGQAFGTGHHGTTAGCLTVMDRVIRRRAVKRALDLGTGSGVLAIALAKTSSANIVASDIDPIAIEVAKSNVALNNVDSRIKLAVADGLQHGVIQRYRPYDLVVANILAGPLMAMAPAIKLVLAPSATLILSGLLPPQRSRVASAFIRQGVYLDRADEFDGWSVLTMRASPTASSKSGGSERQTS